MLLLTADMTDTRAHTASCGYPLDIVPGSGDTSENMDGTLTGESAEQGTGWDGIYLSALLPSSFLPPFLLE